eukprot:GHVS01058359.1.p1 GENE.GHVS01058359.1~~GHVS01058359.1.p1  ORF type:complete len:395 (-),score=47.99 GHVS01058359.1:1240-2361(-)
MQALFPPNASAATCRQQVAYPTSTLTPGYGLAPPMRAVPSLATAAAMPRGDTPAPRYTNARGGDVSDPAVPQVAFRPTNSSVLPGRAKTIAKCRDMLKNMRASPTCATASSTPTIDLKTKKPCLEEAMLGQRGKLEEATKANGEFIERMKEAKLDLPESTTVASVEHPGSGVASVEHPGSGVSPSERKREDISEPEEPTANVQASSSPSASPQYRAAEHPMLPRQSSEVPVQNPLLLPATSSRPSAVTPVCDSSCSKGHAQRTASSKVVLSREPQTGSQHRSLKRVPSPESLSVSSSSCRSSPRSELSSAPRSPVVRLDSQPSQTNQPQEADGSSFIERMRETLFSPRSWMENPEHCHRLLSQMMKIQQQNEV